MPNYCSSEAMREHMLDGNIISKFEAILYFGVQNPSAEIARMRRNGLLIKSQRVPMTKILVRANKFAKCRPPSELPHKEILMIEYWIEQ